MEDVFEQVWVLSFVREFTARTNSQIFATKIEPRYLECQKFTKIYI